MAAGGMIKTTSTRFIITRTRTRARSTSVNYDDDDDDDDDDDHHERHLRKKNPQTKNRNKIIPNNNNNNLPLRGIVTSGESKTATDTRGADITVIHRADNIRTFFFFRLRFNAANSNIIINNIKYKSISDFNHLSHRVPQDLLFDILLYRWRQQIARINLPTKSHLQSVV